MAEQQGRKHYEATDQMPDEYRELLLHVLRIGADIESSLLFPETDYLKHVIDFAPTPEDRVRIADLYLQELQHGYIFYQLLRELGITVRREDFQGQRKLDFANTPIESWLDMAMMNCVADRVGLYQYRQMLDSSYMPLTRVAPKIEKDEVGHAYLGYTTIKRACQTPEGKAEAQRLLNKWYPIALDMFGSPRSKREEAYIKWGLKKYRNEELRQMYLQEVNPLLEGLGLEIPDPTANRRFV